MTASWKHAMQAIRARLRGDRGETITEVLVAIVISGLAILMLATAIASAVNVNNASRDAMNRYYAANNNAVLGDTATASGTVSVTMNGGSISLGNKASIPVTFRIGQQVNDTLVVAYTEEG